MPGSAWLRSARRDVHLLALGGAAVASYGAAAGGTDDRRARRRDVHGRNRQSPRRSQARWGTRSARREAKDQFSGSLLVTHRGRTVLRRSHGFANKGTRLRNRPDTRFFLASVTKIFAALAVHQFVQREKVKYDDKLGTYLQGFPTEVAEMRDSGFFTKPQ